MKKLFILGLISVLLLNSTMLVSARPDEKLVIAESPIYAVEFTVNDVTKATEKGYYQTKVYAIISPDGNYIQKVITEYKRGFRFSVTDEYDDSKKAYTKFLYLGMGFNFVKKQYTIDRSGVITMKKLW